jgi:hypothetical protein
MGSLNGGSFRAIQEYFQQKSCRYCSNSFTSDGIQLIREEPGMLVVRVTCSCCGRPLGVAIVGTGVPQERMRTERPPEWTKKDSQRFAGKPAITYDDVLAAHEFFDGLGADWSRHLPVRGR